MSHASPQSQATDLARLASAAKAASRALAVMDHHARIDILHAMAGGVRTHGARILDANAIEVDRAEAAGLSAALVDRLRLDADRVEAMAAGIEAVAAQPDPLSGVRERIERPNGLVIEKVPAPLGVILMIYESRPNVTADAAALALKSGNAAILRGGSEAFESNRAILDAMLVEVGDRLPRGGLQLVPTTDRGAIGELVRMNDCIDLVIPRGGPGLIEAVVSQSTIPVLKHDAGVCHVYVDRAADPRMALAIVENAKCQRPGVCNAIETLLVDAPIAAAFLPEVAKTLGARGVELRADDAARAWLPDAAPATADDWRAEYLDLILAVRVVDGVEAAIAHINEYGSHHSDAIVTADASAADRFLAAVDSAAVYHNASTRFTDGAEFGLGAEIGISTQKLHARGPCGAAALTTTKYIARGGGQIR